MLFNFSLCYITKYWTPSFLSTCFLSIMTGFVFLILIGLIVGPVDLKVYTSVLGYICQNDPQLIRFSLKNRGAEAQINETNYYQFQKEIQNLC